MFQIFLDDYKSKLMETDEIHRAEKQFPANLAIVGLMLLILLAYCGVQVLSVTLNQELQRMSTFLLLALLVVSVIAIFQVEKQGKRLKVESAWKHQVRIVVLKNLIRDKKYSLNGQAGVEWLIEECKERLGNASIGSRYRSTLNRSFDKVVYPILAFLCGQITNYLSFTKVLGKATTLVAAISLSILVLIMIFPLALDLMNQDLYALDILLDDLLYIKGSEEYNHLQL